MSLFFRLLLSLMRYRASFQLFNYWNLVPLIQGFRLVIEQQHWVPGLTIVNMWKNVTICVCVLLLLQEEQRRQAGKSLNRSSAEPHFESQSSFWRSPNFFFSLKLLSNQKVLGVNKHKQLKIFPKWNAYNARYFPARGSPCAYSKYVEGV